MILSRRPDIERFLKDPGREVRAALIYGRDRGVVSERAKQLAGKIAVCLCTLSCPGGAQYGSTHRRRLRKPDGFGNRWRQDCYAVVITDPFQHGATVGSPAIEERGKHSDH